MSKIKEVKMFQYGSSVYKTKEEAEEVMREGQLEELLDCLTEVSLTSLIKNRKEVMKLFKSWE